jgi:hypothetical protein
MAVLKYGQYARRVLGHKVAFVVIGPAQKLAIDADEEMTLAETSFDLP